MRSCKAWAFGALAAVLVLMIAATVLEKLYGTPFAFRWVYHSPWFIALWGVAAAGGVLYFFRYGAGKQAVTLMLHLSFVVILAGAFVTFLFGIQGVVHLRKGAPVSSFTAETGEEREFPFSLELENFEIAYYRGSQAASGYRSALRIGGVRDTVSLNHIVRVRGYRLSQADYDEDLGGSVLAVSYDPWGISLTYSGYGLLLLSMIGFFFQKDSRFKAVLRRVAASAAAIAGVAVLSELPSEARERVAVEKPKVLPAEVAEQFGELFVYYNDRIAPLQTLARDYTLKAYGKTHYQEFTAEQVLTGWLFCYDWWQAVPFKLKKSERGTANAEEKMYLLRSVASGDALKLFPVAAPEPPHPVAWFSCNDPLPDYVLDDYDHWVFIRKVLDLVQESVRRGDWAEVRRIVGKIREHQLKTAAPVLPSPQKVRSERLYNRISRPRAPFMASVTAGLALFVLYGLALSRRRAVPKGLRQGFAVLAGCLCLYLSAVLGLRWYISGHAPFAGSYSVMMLMAWLSTVAMLLLYRKFPLIQPLGFLLAGFTMLVASLASAGPQVTHLMPVLQSPLLSVHVLSMMLSYTLFGLVALNGLMGLAVPAAEAKEMLRDLSLVILYPAVFLLAFGTFLGAVWANISWGSYWTWDPKETWALITLLLYAAFLHSGSLKAFRNPRFFHACTLFAFLSVLVTYFGVNLLLGGLHSYA